MALAPLPCILRMFRRNRCLESFSICPFDFLLIRDSVLDYNQCDRETKDSPICRYGNQTQIKREGTLIYSIPNFFIVDPIASYLQDIVFYGRKSIDSPSNPNLFSTERSTYLDQIGILSQFKICLHALDEYLDT